jgi:hypothetical protein
VGVEDEVFGISMAMIDRIWTTVVILSEIVSLLSENIFFSISQL